MTQILSIERQAKSALPSPEPGVEEAIAQLEGLQPQQVVDTIFAFYEKRGFEPSPAEREVLLNL